MKDLKESGKWCKTGLKANYKERRM